MVVNPVEQQGFVSEMSGGVGERASASIRVEMSQGETKGPMHSPMPVSDNIESGPALSVYLSQSYQHQQAYFDTARRMEIAAVGLGRTDQGTLPMSREATILRPAEIFISMTEVGWKAVLPYKPYIYHNFMWREPQEQISIVW